MPKLREQLLTATLVGIFMICASYYKVQNIQNITFYTFTNVEHSYNYRSSETLIESANDNLKLLRPVRFSRRKGSSTCTFPCKESILMCDPLLNCLTGRSTENAFTVNLTILQMPELENKFPEVEHGGLWMPKQCTSKSFVAIMVAYRDREEHFKILLNNLIPFLQAQMTAFKIFLVEQGPGQMFNRAALLNAGFLLSSKFGEFDCFIFHDVDLLPENLCNIYSCAAGKIRSMAIAVDKYNYTSMYDLYCGGSIAIDRAMMETINGFTNVMYGWGGEDDDIYFRVKQSGYNVTRYPPEIARYTMIKHKNDSSNPKSGRSFKAIFGHWIYSKYDGLGSARFILQTIEERLLYTRLVISFDGGPTTLDEAKDQFVTKRKLFRSQLIHDDSEREKIIQVAQAFNKSRIPLFADLNFTHKKDINDVKKRKKSSRVKFFRSQLIHDDSELEKIIQVAQAFNKSRIPLFAVLNFTHKKDINDVKKSSRIKRREMLKVKPQGEAFQRNEMELKSKQKPIVGINNRFKLKRGTFRNKRKAL